MEFADALKRVEAADCFAESDAYLAHGFLTVEGGDAGEWHVGYYAEDADEATTYRVTSEGVVRDDPEGVFKEGDSVLPLDRKAIAVSAAQALDIAEELRAEKYAEHPASKQVLILQHLPEGQVYNITLVTTTLNMLNVKVDAESGDVVSEDFASLMSLRADQP